MLGKLEKSSVPYMDERTNFYQKFKRGQELDMFEQI